MALICYHASHEQFPPSQLLKWAVAAEQAGFDGLHSSDHFHPWGRRQGHSGFSFAWVAAALQATSLPMSMVCAPGQRYHPAIVAQAIATLAEMFPNRFAVELGSGEALNECITGTGWPEKPLRDERLLQSTEVIRRLLRGENVNADGLVKVENARLWTLPESTPPLLGAAVTKPSAEWVASWADGLLTTVAKDLYEAEAKVRAYLDAGGKREHIHLQYAFSYARQRDDAIEGAWHQWCSYLGADAIADLRTPEEFDAQASSTSKEEMLETTAIHTDMAALLGTVRELEAMGATRVILHNMNTCHEAFIADFAAARRAA